MADSSERVKTEMDRVERELIPALVTWASVPTRLRRMDEDTESMMFVWRVDIVLTTCCWFFLFVCCV